MSNTLLHRFVQAVLLLLGALAVFASCCASGAEVKILPLDAAFLKALHMQEASGKLNPPDGDSGRAIGIYQIWRAYWQDAVEFDKTLGGTYQDCRKPEYAAKIVRAYLNRYAHKAIIAKDFEALARLHNGGPSWKKRPIAVVSTAGYWADFKRHL